MFWMLPLAGAALGAMSNKKNPLKGAMMGGALGATGGALAPAAGGLLGASAATGTGLAAGGTGLGLTAATGAGTGLAAGGSGLGLVAGPGSVMGAQGGGLLASMSQYKPILDAASTGMQVAGSMNQPDQPIQAPQLQQQTGGQTLQALAQNSPQMNIQAEAEMRKKRRMGLLGGMA